MQNSKTSEGKLLSEAGQTPRNAAGCSLKAAEAGAGGGTWEARPAGAEENAADRNAPGAWHIQEEDGGHPEGHREEGGSHPAAHGSPGEL